MNQNIDLDAVSSLMKLNGLARVQSIFSCKRGAQHIRETDVCAAVLVPGCCSGRWQLEWRRGPMDTCFSTGRVSGSASHMKTAEAHSTAALMPCVPNVPSRPERTRCRRTAPCH